MIHQLPHQITVIIDPPGGKFREEKYLVYDPWNTKELPGVEFYTQWKTEDFPVWQYGTLVIKNGRLIFSNPSDQSLSEYADYRSQKDFQEEGEE